MTYEPIKKNTFRRVPEHTKGYTRKWVRCPVCESISVYDYAKWANDGNGDYPDHVKPCGHKHSGKLELVNQQVAIPEYLWGKNNKSN